jgi:hypothetical protein
MPALPASMATYLLCHQETFCRLVVPVPTVMLWHSCFGILIICILVCAVWLAV